MRKDGSAKVREMLISPAGIGRAEVSTGISVSRFAGGEIPIHILSRTRKECSDPRSRSQQTEQRVSLR
jgi:hypothetical protein